MSPKWFPWLGQIEKKIGISFKNKSLLWQAFVHRSYLNENRDFVLGSNERLEFLGDKVLGMVIADYLYRNYSFPEGQLTDILASLVKSKACAQISKNLDLAKYLLMSKGQKEQFKGKAQNMILAGTLEALIGAIYLDRGLGTAEIFITEYMLDELPVILEKELYIDSKGQLQELAQEKLHVTPRYEVLWKSGPDHDKKWYMGAFFNDRKVGEGLGLSKKEAEEKAAEDALQKEFQFSQKD